MPCSWCWELPEPPASSVTSTRHQGQHFPSSAWREAPAAGAECRRDPWSRRGELQIPTLCLPGSHYPALLPACPPSFPPASQERPLWFFIHIPFQSLISGNLVCSKAQHSSSELCPAGQLLPQGSLRCVHSTLSTHSTPVFHLCYISPGAPG